MTPLSKLLVGLVVLAALIVGVVLAVDASSGLSVREAKAVINSRSVKVCRAYRISCSLTDYGSDGRLQVLTGTRGGVTAREAITYGTVSESLIRAALRCPKADSGPGCGGASFDDADGLSVGYYSQPQDPLQPAPERDEVGMTPLTALRIDLLSVGALGEDEMSGWDKWAENFNEAKARPAEPCRPGYRKTWPPNPDGSTSSPPDPPCIIAGP